MPRPPTAGLLLDDTFVLAWDQSADSLTFFVLASLLPEHPEFSAPTEGDWTCYRAGLIQFRGVTSVDGLVPQASIVPTTDASGSVDYGCIDHLSLVEPGKYRVGGEFGDVLVVAERVLVVLAPAHEHVGEDQAPASEYGANALATGDRT